MKNGFGLALIALLGLSMPALAQDKKENVAKKAWHGTKKGAKKAWHGTKKGAKAVGNETAELSVKGAAHVADQKSDRWTGPEGQTIYVTADERYYWVNGKGKRIFVSKAALKARHK